MQVGVPLATVQLQAHLKLGFQHLRTRMYRAEMWSSIRLHHHPIRNTGSVSNTAARFEHLLEWTIAGEVERNGQPQGVGGMHQVHHIHIGTGIKIGLSHTMIVAGCMLGRNSPELSQAFEPCPPSGSGRASSPTKTEARDQRSDFM